MKYSVKYKKVFDKENHIVDISSVTPENKMSEYYSIGTHTPMTAIHFVGEKKYSPQPPIVIETKIPTKFYCYPQLGLASPLKAYYDNVEIGMLFASNTFAKPFVFDKAMSIDEKNFVVMGKDIYGAVKPWVVYVVSWNGRNYYHKVLSHFDYQSALKDFTLAQGKEWHGGDTLSDEC